MKIIKWCLKNRFDTADWNISYCYYYTLGPQASTGLWIAANESFVTFNRSIVPLLQIFFQKKILFFVFSCRFPVRIDPPQKKWIGKRTQEYIYIYIRIYICIYSSWKHSVRNYALAVQSMICHRSYFVWNIHFHVTMRLCKIIWIFLSINFDTDRTKNSK